MSPLISALTRIPLLLRQTVFWCVWSMATLLMLLPANDLPTVNLWDKAEHAITFAALMLLAWTAFQHRYSQKILAFSLIAYGIAIECIQYFIPSRSFSVLDMVADSTGVFFILLLILVIKKYV